MKNMITDLFHIGYGTAKEEVKTLNLQTLERRACRHCVLRAVQHTNRPEIDELTKSERFMGAQTMWMVG